MNRTALHVSAIIYSHLQGEPIYAERPTSLAHSLVKLQIVKYSAFVTPFYSLVIIYQGYVKIRFRLYRIVKMLCIRHL